ncbi:uncharacterized protein HD556DRAFT_1241544 [Suillus plorans]|uniref:Uncharacterized protein n=1 Tax=Suillus plorans TaxID=116603 RepID=A0A9P7DEH7_9AGAM|nr:uncharacterized protein HD556DRAFT_1241544 [Suillus plorans]KAG1790938.1 hypothetical protein HD556DRAFT_1241544 [Suillus plorans]
MATHSCKHVQAPCCCIKVTLSKEARAALTAQRRDKSRRFETDLHSAWTEIDETMKSISSSHHKSFRHVQNELCMGRGMLCYQRLKLNAWNTFCWKKRNDRKANGGGTGKAVLQELVKDEENRTKYHKLMEDEKASLLAEYAEHKQTKTSGIRISAKAKVNDVTHTLKAIENEATHQLTGVETILYMTRGSTDCPLRGVAFVTEGVSDFMGTVMNIDSQDLVSKMEGFYVQGMQGAAKNHQKPSSAIRGAIRNEINKTLHMSYITRDPKAKMHWANYWRNVVQRYLVIVEGWPDNIPFVNLSSVSSALPDLEMLLRKWQSNAIHWRRLEEDEYLKLLEERNEKLEQGEIAEECRRTRSDKGKKHVQTSDSSRHKKAFKSAETVVSDDENDEDKTAPATASTHALTGVETTILRGTNEAPDCICKCCKVARCLVCYT